jgi:hypothetical protein
MTVTYLALVRVVWGAPRAQREREVLDGLERTADELVELGCTEPQLERFVEAFDDACAQALMDSPVEDA